MKIALGLMTFWACFATAMWLRPYFKCGFWPAYFAATSFALVIGIVFDGLWPQL